MEAEVTAKDIVLLKRGRRAEPPAEWRADDHPDEQINQDRQDRGQEEGENQRPRRVADQPGHPDPRREPPALALDLRPEGDLSRQRENGEAPPEERPECDLEPLFSLFALVLDDHPSPLPPDRSQSVRDSATMHSLSPISPPGSTRANGSG